MTKVVLIAFEPGVATALRAAIEQRTDVTARVVVASSEPLAAQIEALNEEEGAVPIGVAVRTATEVLDAIEAGADEAMAVEECLLPQSLHELVDRARLRGTRRADQERRRAAMLHAERLAALGALVASVAHEVNNPLAALSLSLEALPPQVEGAAKAIEELRRAHAEGRGLSADEVAHAVAMATAFRGWETLARYFEDMSEAARSVAEVVRDLRVLARNRDTPVPEVVRVPEVLDQVLRMVGREITVVGTIERDHPPDLPELVLSRPRLVQVLINLLVNAAHAIREVARPVHRVRVTARFDDEAVAIVISDTGPGIPPEAIPRIFDPFYTTKRAGLGTGLGLSISRDLVRGMGGELLVESVHGDGATFVLLLPRPSEEALRQARRAQRVVPASTRAPSRATLLVVEEDPLLLRGYARALSTAFHVLLASDAREAVDLLSSGSRIDALLVDGALSDAEVLHGWVREHAPALAARTVRVAADPDALDAEERVADVVPKSASAALLIETLQGALRREPSGSEPPAG